MNGHKTLQQKFSHVVLWSIVCACGAMSMAGCESKADKITKQHQQEAIDLANTPREFKDPAISEQPAS